MEITDIIPNKYLAQLKTQQPLVIKPLAKKILYRGFITDSKIYLNSFLRVDEAQLLKELDNFQHGDIFKITKTDVECLEYGITAFNKNEIEDCLEASYYKKVLNLYTYVKFAMPYICKAVPQEKFDKSKKLCHLMDEISKTIDRIVLFKKIDTFNIYQARATVDLGYVGQYVNGLL